MQYKTTVVYVRSKSLDDLTAKVNEMLGNGYIKTSSLIVSQSLLYIQPLEKVDIINPSISESQYRTIARCCHEMHNELCREYNEEVREWHTLLEEHVATILSTIDKIEDGTFKTPQDTHLNYVKRKQEAGISTLRTKPWHELREQDKIKEIVFFRTATQLIYLIKSTKI